MNYFNRKIDRTLQQWSKEKRRKPLMLRGARQVGKTSAIRNLSKQFKYFVEINFENKDHSAAKKVFSHHSEPQIICSELTALFGIPIVPIEVKSGTQGKMQSMRIYLKERNVNYGIRTSLENFCTYQKIYVYPLYAIGQILTEFSLTSTVHLAQ